MATAVERPWQSAGASSSSTWSAPRAFHGPIRAPGPRHCFRAAQTVRCASRKLEADAILSAVAEEVAASAPATIANLGPGFDWLGCAVEGPGDVVVARADRKSAPGTVSISSITGDGGRLSLDASDNCVGIAASATLALLPGVDCGVSLELHKGLPLGSGLGSSAASAAAAAAAVNALFGNRLTAEELVPAGLESEAAVSGRHADNIAPALMGGFVLVRGLDPVIDLQRLACPAADAIWFALVNPRFEAPTAKMRAALRKEVPMRELTANCAAGASLVAAILTGDVPLLGRSLNADVVVEPVRAPLIPGFAQVKRAALEAGAFGAAISGAGPTAVAVVPDPATGERVARAMSEAFLRHGGLETNSSQVVRLDSRGARQI